MQTGIIPCKANFDGMQFVDIYSFHTVEILLWGVCTHRAAVTLTLPNQAHPMKAKQAASQAQAKTPWKAQWTGGRTQGISSFSAIYHLKQSKLF